MEIPRPVRYFAALDVFGDARMREAAIHMSYGTDPNDALPFDSGFRAAGEIYATRVVGMVRHAGTMMLRFTGIDAAYRIITNTDFPA